MKLNCRIIWKNEDAENAKTSYRTNGKQDDENQAGK